MAKTWKHYDTVIDYVTGVVSGEILANEYRIKGCQRFLDDLKNPAYDFNPKDAIFCIDLIEGTVCHQQGEMFDGTPLRGQPFLLLPFHKFIIYNLLGFKIAGTNLNRFHEALIFMPRKNIKTSFAAALAFALGILYRMSGSKIYVVAAALKQAMESFNFVKYNIENMEANDCFRIIDNNNEHSITGEISDGLFNFVALACNPDTQDSFNCNVAIADEIHAFKKVKQYTLFKEAMKAYSNKLMIGISTAGDDPSGFLAQQVKYCKSVLDRTTADEQYFIFICEADPVKTESSETYYDYTNPIVHEMANPAYGHSIRPGEILNTSIQAQANPQLRKDFFAKELNIFTSSVDAYFDMGIVRASDEKYNWTIEELVKLPIKWYGGADLSKMHDLTGVAIHGEYNGVDISISHAFMPVLLANTKAEEDNIPYPWWAEMGWLTMCNGEVIDYDDPVKWFLMMKKLGFKIKWIGYDQRYSRKFISSAKKVGLKVRNQSQRYVEKTEAFRHVENQYKEHKFYYCHNRAYEYCIENVKGIEMSDDFIQYEKVDPHHRIDLFDADVIAAKQMLIDKEKSQNAKEWLGDE